MNVSVTMIQPMEFLLATHRVLAEVTFYDEGEVECHRSAPSGAKHADNALRSRLPWASASLLRAAVISSIETSLKQCCRYHPYAGRDSAPTNCSTDPVPGGNEFFYKHVRRDHCHPEKIHHPRHKQQRH